MKYIYLIPFMLAFGCVSATASIPDVCYTSDAQTIPASPIAGIKLNQFSFSKDADMSYAFNNDVSNQLIIDNIRLSINDDIDLKWLDQIDINIAGAPGSGMESKPFASYCASGAVGTSVPMVLKMDATTALGYLKHPVFMTFILSGTAQTHPVNLTSTLCVNIAAKFSKSL